MNSRDLISIGFRYIGELQTLLEEYQVLFLDSSFSSSGDALDKTGKNSRGMERTNKHGGVVHNN